MKNYLKIFAPVALAIIVGSLTFAFAQTGKSEFGETKTGDQRERRMPPPDGMRPGGGGLPPHILEQLNLTDAQKQQIQTIETASRDASKENFDKMRGYDEQLRKSVESGAFNEEQARQILNSKAQTMVEMELVHLRSEASIFKILTTDQKAQLEQLKQQRPGPPRGDVPPQAPPQN